MIIKKLVALCSICVLFGCQFTEEVVPLSPSEKGSIAFKISVAPNSHFKKVAKKAEVTVSASDMESIIKPLQITDTSIEGKVSNIPSGLNRKFSLSVYDSMGIECYNGMGFGNISRDSIAQIYIHLIKSGGSAVINGTVSEDSIIPPSGPFLKDSSTVFLANFNFNLTDFVSGDSAVTAGEGFGFALFRKSLQLDSTYIGKAICRFPNSPKISLSGTGSIEALVRANKISGGFMHIVDKSWQYGLTVYNGKIAVDFGTKWWFSSVSMPVNQWVYLGGTYDGKTIRLFMNGVQVDSAAYIRDAGSTGYNLGIGNADDNGFDIPFRGNIDEVRISNTARTPSEFWKNGQTILAKIPM